MARQFDEVAISEGTLASSIFLLCHLGLPQSGCEMDDDFNLQKHMDMACRY